MPKFLVIFVLGLLALVTVSTNVNKARQLVQNSDVQGVLIAKGGDDSGGGGSSSGGESHDSGGSSGSSSSSGGSSSGSGGGASSAPITPPKGFPTNSGPGSQNSGHGNLAQPERMIRPPKPARSQELEVEHKVKNEIKDEFNK